jgi:hypothetical protein
MKDPINEAYKESITESSSYWNGVIRDMMSQISVGKVKMIKATDEELHFIMDFLGNKIEMYSYSQTSGPGKDSGYVKVNGKDVSNKLPSNITEPGQQSYLLKDIIKAGLLK